jgi:putative ABC transport system permease protein
MGAIKGAMVRLRALLDPRATEHDLDEEIRFHIELETEKNLRLGLAPEEARRRALVSFGGVQRTREDHRDVRGARWVGEGIADVRFALRTLRKTPALAIAAILTLALGIGANTAIFSAVNAVILRPLPFTDPGRLVMLWEENPDRGWHENVVAPANALDWREQVAAFEDVAAYNSFSNSVTLAGAGTGEPQVVTATGVTGNFFSLLGVRAQRGRILRDEETWDSHPRVAVISDRLWRRSFGADPGIVGRTIQLDGREIQVVGVAPQGFAFPEADVDLWTPVRWGMEDRGQVYFRRAHWLRAVARLRPGVSLDRANVELQTVVRRLQKQYPETNTHMGAGMTPLHEFIVGDTRLPLLVLLSAVSLLLLIACANVGNLLLVQAAGREREAALRLALGAGRGRLVRQALAESLVLSALGGAAGLALGWWGARILAALQPAGMLPVRDVSPSWSVLGYVLLITTASGLLFGIAPALWSGRRAPVEVLNEGGRSGSEGRRMRHWGDTLVIAEVALALLLTLGAGLLVRSFRQLQNVDPGFDASGTLTAEISLPGMRYDTQARITSFFDELLDRARSLPGVSGAGAVSQLPLTTTAWTSDFAIAGRGADEYGTEVVHRETMPGYFHVMRVPLLAGRVFTDRDGQDAPRVVIINEALAKKFFSGEDPIGQKLAFDKVPDSASIWRTIIGVVGSEHQGSMTDDPQIEIFAPVAQASRSSLSVVLRTESDPASLGPALRRLVKEMDPALAIGTMKTMSVVRSESLARQRFLTTLLTAFASIGLLLALVGVYGVMAQLARRRSREMGIRIALGASAPHIEWMVVGHALRLVVVAVLVGTVVALLTTRALSALLYHVAPVDPITFVVVPLLLALTAAVATWLPARQAGRADPAVVLRGE